MRIHILFFFDGIFSLFAPLPRDCLPVPHLSLTGPAPPSFVVSSLWRECSTCALCEVWLDYLELKFISWCRKRTKTKALENILLITTK